ncbi:MAG TPA: hypothetical protein VJ276_13360 [Thermoanaerobaculia bacterium]|nr:hypothetical protein [Thermoanaerobaculia bacterium]
MRRAVLAFFLLLPLPAAAATDVAGSYYQGDGLGLNWGLVLDADHSFAFKWRGCLGVYGSAHGQWRLEGDRLHLIAKGQPDGMAERMPLEYVVVRWGPRTYLVEAEEVVAFCNLINQKWEPRDESFGMVYLRDHDWDLLATGRPQLPKQYQPYILDHPVRARVIDRNRIDAGASEGLLPEMVVVAESVTLRIVKVREHDADVEALYEDKVPAAGTKVATRREE